jgi:hypothetical protein
MKEEPAIFHAPSWIGQVDVSSGVLQIGDLLVNDVGEGYKMANVYVDRVSGIKEGLPVGIIHIEIIGDYYAQRELDEENYWLEQTGAWYTDDGVLYYGHIDIDTCYCKECREDIEEE